MLNAQGRIESARSFNVGKERHLLVRLRNQAGKMIVADLGSAAELRQQRLRLRRGATLAVRGIPGRIDGQPVLIAVLAATDGQQMQMQRGQQQRKAQRAAKQIPPGARAVIQGQVVSAKQVQLQGVNRPHTFLKVRGTQGQMAVVDIGPHMPKTLGLTRGERVIVIGDPARVSGQPVVLGSNIAQLRGAYRLRQGR